MMSSIFSGQKKLVNRLNQDSSRERRQLRVKYDKLMRSRPVLIWAR